MADEHTSGHVRDMGGRLIGRTRSLEDEFLKQAVAQKDSCYAVVPARDKMRSLTLRLRRAGVRVVEREDMPLDTVFLLEGEPGDL